MIYFAVITEDQYNGLVPYSIGDLIEFADCEDDIYDLECMLVDSQCNFDKIDDRTYRVTDIYGDVRYYISMTDC